MHIKRIHEMVEELTECALSAIKANESRVGDFAIPDVIDMIKDLCCAEKDAREAKEKEKEEEDEKKENEYFLKMLKEEYGEEEGEKRFYSGQPRSRTSGRFMRRGDGRRRGYEEPPYLHMPVDYRMDMEDYTAYPPEYWRDVDRHLGRMYYTDGGSMGGRTMGDGYSNRTGGGTNGGNSGMSNGDSANSVRGYSDGYSDGMRDGRNLQSRDKREGRSGRMRRGYMETKEMNKDNSPESKQKRMKDLEAYAKELTEDMIEMVENASPEEHALLKQKMQILLQKL